MRILIAAFIALHLAPTLAAGPASETLASGVVVQQYREGEGEPPRLADVVQVHYQGTLANGREFDSSYSRGKPAEFPVNAVIPCWTEVLQRIRPGAAVRIACPPETAYGKQGVPGKIPPDSTLTFVIELLDVKR